MKKPFTLFFLLFFFSLPAWCQTALFHDEFLRDSINLNWQNIARTEGWSAGQPEILRIDPYDGGQLLLSPGFGEWNDGDRGSFLYRPARGNFIFTAELSLSHRNGAQFPPSQGAFAGCLVRAPTRLNPYSYAPVSENYTYLALGNGGMEHPSCTGCHPPNLAVKVTSNNKSNEFISPAQGYSATLRIARIDSILFLLVKYPGGAYALHQKTVRLDLPEELQVGLMLNLPNTRGNAMTSPGIMACFRYARLEALTLPPAFQGKNPYFLTERELMAFLGDPPSAKPAEEKEVREEKWVSLWKTGPDAQADPKGGDRFPYTWDKPSNEFRSTSWSGLKSEMRVQDARWKQLSRFEANAWQSGFSASWSEDEEKKVVVRTRSLEKMERELETRSLVYHRMVDLDVSYEGGAVMYYGIWGRGQAEQRLFETFDPRKFAEQHAAFAQMNYHLADIEAVPVRDRTLYVGLWQEGATPVKLVFHDSRDHFEATRAEMEKAGRELVELVRRR